LAFGCENFALPPAEIRRRVSGVTEDWELEGILGRSVFALSGGQKQRVICAAVDAMDTRALVLDEPSANLDAPATAQLADLIRRWQEQGKAILIAEHRLAYLAPLADRFIRLEAGRVTHRLTATRLRALGPAKLADLGLRPVDGEATEPDIAPAARLAAPADAPGCQDADPEDAGCQGAGGRDAGLGGIELRNVSYWRPHRAGRKYGRQVIGIGQLDLRQGQIAALTGPNGAGKTTLLRLIAGVAPGGRGEMRVNGQLWRRRRRLLGVALVGQDVNQQLFADTVRGELTLANRRLSDLEVDAILGSFGLADLGSRHPLALSAGERQRLAIAAAFAQDRPVVALDEPTSGLDLGHMRQVAAGIRQLGAAGRTVLVATHDQELVAACAERVITLQDGLLTS
jgi:energy-coupling factor transport system ATP-binding protein